MSNNRNRQNKEETNKEIHFMDPIQEDVTVVEPQKKEKVKSSTICVN